MCTIASIDRDELITFFALWFLSSVFFGSFVMLMSLWVYNLFSKIFTPKVYKLPVDYFDEFPVLPEHYSKEFSLNVPCPAYIDSYKKEPSND